MAVDARIHFVLLAFSLAILPPRAASVCSQVDKLSVQLSWVNSAEFAGFVVPNSGIPGTPQYGEEPSCLAVQVREGGPSFDPLQELANDRADVALCEGAYAAQQIAMGKDYKIIASFSDMSSLALVGLQKLALSSFEDLKHKKIGMARLGYELSVKLMLQNSGVSQTSMAFINQSSSNHLDDLRQGKVDVATATHYRDLGEVLRWLNPSTHFLTQEEEIAIFRTAEKSAPALHNVLVVKSVKLPMLRQRLVRFLDVVARTWIYCRDQEDSCMKAWPYSSPLQRRLLRETLKLIFPSSSFGVLSASKWEAVNGSLVSAGLIPLRSYSAIDNSLMEEVVAADASVNINAKAAYDPGNVNFCAPYNSEVPLRICVGQEHKPCQQGFVPPANTSGNCIACAPGRFSRNAWTDGESRLNVCEHCVPGRYSSSSGQRECKLCDTGKFIDGVGGTSCAQCLPGRSAPSTGMSACELCPKGRFTMGLGSFACAPCNDGTYADSLGSSQCTTCLGNTTTRGHGAVYRYDCACPRGKYRTDKGHCEACPTGFICHVGSDEAVLRSFGGAGYVSGQYPQLLPGYWTSRADPLSVYLCRNTDFCPGGAPQTCAPYMEDIACSLCQKGYFRQGQKCESCTGFDNTEFNYPTLPAVFGPLVVVALYFYMWDQVDKWGSYANELWSLAFVVVVHYQIVGLVVGANVPWPSQIFGTLYVWEYFVDFSEMLRLDCIGDSDVYRGFKNFYMVKAMQPLFLLAMFGLVYLIGFVIAALGLCVRKSGQKWLDRTFKAFGMFRFTKMEPKLAMDPSVLFNNYMAIFQMFYVSFCFISLELFMCYENPNGKKTLTFGPNVECDGQDWQRMLGEGILMMIPVSGLPVAAFIFAAMMAPKHFSRKGFTARWKFLLIKWRPDVWWWSPVVLIRALLLCLTHVVSQEGQRQLLWQLAVLVFYTGSTAVLRPWRTWCGNVLDLEVCGSLILFVALGCSFVTRSGWLDDHISHFGAVATFAGAAAFVPLVAWIACYGLGAMSFRASWDRKLAEDAQAAFPKFIGLDKKAAEAFVTKLSGHDRKALQRVWFIISVELLKEPGRSRHFQWLDRQKTPAAHEVISLQGPRPREEEDPAMLFDPGDIVEPTKWGEQPPHRNPPIHASRGGDGADKTTIFKALKKNDDSQSTTASQPVEDLGNGWRSTRDAKGREYYYHISDPEKTSTRKRPEVKDLGQGWRSTIDATGIEYFFNVSDPRNTTTRHNPLKAVPGAAAAIAPAAGTSARAPLAATTAAAQAQQQQQQQQQSDLKDMGNGWRSTNDTAGKEYYFHISDPKNTTTRNPPPQAQDLGNGWRSMKDPSGREYFFQASDPRNTTTWNRPREVDSGAGVGNVTGTDLPQASAQKDAARPRPSSDMATRVQQQQQQQQTADGTRVIMGQPKPKK